MWTTRSPGVSRSRMSRGTTRRSAFGRRTRTVPNSSRSVTKARPSGPPVNPPLRLRSTSATAPGGGASATRLDDGGRVAGLGEELGQARRLVRGERRSGRRRPARRRPPRRAGRHDRAAGPARASRTDRRTTAPPRAIATSSGGTDSQVSSSVREATRRPFQSRGGEVGRRPVRRAARRPRSARRGARRPGATGTRPPRRCRRARRARAACPARRGRGRSPGRGGRPRPRRRRRRRGRASARPCRGPRGGRVAVEPGEVGGEALGQPSRPRARGARGSRPRRRRGSRNSDAGSRTAGSMRATVRWSVGSKARSESISSPKNSIRIGSGSDGGKTSTIPPRRANSPRPATSMTGT